MAFVVRKGEWLHTSSTALVGSHSKREEPPKANSSINTGGECCSHTLSGEMAEHWVPRVWIVGSSDICMLQADLCHKNLCLPCFITWDGEGGRLWEHLLPTLRSLKATGPEPEILVVHLGGSSLCLEGRNRLDILREIKADLTRVFEMFPRTRVLFSDILPRLKWRGQTGRTAYGIERSRRWLNGAVSGFLSDRNMRCIWHGNIGLTHLIKDGVHLGPEGNQLFLNNLREALQVELKHQRPF
ncbi:hypothetical protein QQF64_023830 [Cirrhinus molitorella]|uniref:SGNH hydrolase-type esterase domain-containing protein n=1 Tax=Cirrhinus molitorella TaxID=172907 RepID=A0ABR3NJG4_9TELE